MESLPCQAEGSAYSGSKGLLEGAIGNDITEVAVWQLYLVWIKTKIKIRDTGEEAVSITHKTRGSGEGLLKAGLP